MQRAIRLFLGAFCAGLFFLPLAAGAQERLERIAATVNEDAVSVSDVNRRMELVISSSGLPDAPEMRAKLWPQVVGMLIDEQVRLQEAKRLELAINEAEVEAGIDTIGQQNGMTGAQFLDMLKARHIDPATLKRQIRSQIAWAQVVQKELRPKVDITDADVETERDRLVGNLGKTEYLVAEIFLPVDDPAREKETHALADKLVAQILETNAPFPAIARQFSRAAGAGQDGGDIGWVLEGQLDTELDQALRQMNEGQISPPIRTASGYHILMLRHKRTVSEKTLPSEDEIRNRLGMQRLDRLQRRYLLDLKGSAFIDRRV